MEFCLGQRFVCGEAGEREVGEALDMNVENDTLALIGNRKSKIGDRERAIEPGINEIVAVSFAN